MRHLLLLFFFVLLAADMLGLNLSLAPGLSVKNALLYLIFIAIAIDTALHRNRSIELPSVIIPYAMCLAYAIFTWLVIVLIIDYPGYSTLRSLINLKGGLADHLIVFLVFFYGILNARDAGWLMRAMLWMVILANLISVMDALNLPDLGLINERRDGRIGGPVGESNQYALFISLFLPGIVALALAGRGWVRGLAILGTCVSALALLLTASRGGILGLLAGSVLAFVFLRRFVPLRVALSALAGLMVFVVFAALMAYFAGYGELLYERFITQSLGGAHETSSGRTTIWATALAKMFEAPLTLITGYGWNSYSTFRDFGYAPHNSYLGIFFELGIIGLILVLVSFGNILRVARSALATATPGRKPMLLAFIFGFFAVLLGVFFVELSSPWLFVWAYVGVSMRLALEAAAPAEEPNVSPVPARAEFAGAKNALRRS